MPVKFTDATPPRTPDVCLMLAIVLVFALATGCDATESRVKADKLSLPRVGGKAVRPFGARNAKAIAFVFISTECPISNRYAPEVQRLQEKFGAEGVAFWLVYPNVGESEQAVQHHLKEFRYNAPALRDPKHQLVKLSQVRVTPEAAIYRSNGELLYHGRIDDRNVDFGKERPQPTVRDFEDALAAVLEGRTPKPAGGRPVGCPIQ